MAASPLPKELAQARSQFQAWRRRRRAGNRIPPPLWTLAVRLANAQWPQSHRHGSWPRLLRLEKAGPGVRRATIAPGTGVRRAVRPLPIGKQGRFELDNGAGVTLAYN